MTSVQVAGITVAIEFFSDKRLVATEGYNDGPILGESNESKHTIHIYDSPHPGEVEITFYHELMHQLVGMYHIRDIRNKDGSHVEDSIDLLAVGLQEALSSLGIDIKEYIR